MKRTIQRHLVAAVAAFAMFPTAAVAADVAAAPQHPAPLPHATDPYMPPPQLWSPGPYTTWPPVGTGDIRGRVVTSYQSLNVRSGPGTGYWAVGSVGRGSTVHILCKKNGSNVRGNYRWYKLSDRKGYVSARYVSNLSTVPWC